MGFIFGDWQSTEGGQELTYCPDCLDWLYPGDYDGKVWYCANCEALWNDSEVLTKLPDDDPRVNKHE